MIASVQQKRIKVDVLRYFLARNHHILYKKKTKVTANLRPMS